VHRFAVKGSDSAVFFTWFLFKPQVESPSKWLSSTGYKRAHLVVGFESRLEAERFLEKFREPVEVRPGIAGGQRRA
jgi:hypothetical protein